MTPANAPSPHVIERRRGIELVDWRELVAHRDLLSFLVLRDVKVLYKQSVLGVAWAIVGPLFSMVVFTVVFSRLARVPSDGVPYPIFSYTALVAWTYFAAASTASTASLITNASLLSKVYFPRLFLPLTPVIAKLLDFAIAFSLLGVMLVGYGMVPRLTILWLPLYVFVMVLTAAGIGTWLSALALKYRDVKFAVPLLTQLLMFAAPVVWPASLVPEPYRAVYGLYPMVGVIEGLRSSLLQTTPLPWDLLLPGTLSAVVLAVSGAFYFRRVERHFADVA